MQRKGMIEKGLPFEIRPEKSTNECIESSSVIPSYYEVNREKDILYSSCFVIRMSNGITKRKSFMPHIYIVRRSSQFAFICKHT